MGTERPVRRRDDSSDLAEDGGIGDPVIVGEEERLAEDDREHLITLEGEEDPAGRRAARDVLALNDAEILVIRLHQDVAAAEVDLVRADLPADDEELVRERAARPVVAVPAVTPAGRRRGSEDFGYGLDNPILSLYYTGMDTLKRRNTSPQAALEQAGGILADAERRLRELVGSAAAAGAYDAVQRITDLARTLGTLADEARKPRADERPPPDPRPAGDDDGGSNGWTQTVRRLADGPGVTPPERKASVRPRKHAPAKGEYPKFSRRGDQLVKTGWSKKAREEYEHKAPRRVIDALTAAIARRSGNGKRFTVEDLFPLKDPQDGSEFPGYQVYVALAWFKSAGLVKQHGRSGYTVRNSSHLAEVVATAWPQIPGHDA